MKAPITDQHKAAALVQLSTLRFFPAESLTQRAIIRTLESICGNPAGLAWLISQLVNHVGEWPGPAEVRAIYCTRYKPADGIEAQTSCMLPGFTPDDCEGRSRRELPRLSEGEAQRMLTGVRSGGPVVMEVPAPAVQANPRTPAHIRSDIGFWSDLEKRLSSGRSSAGGFTVAECHKNLARLRLELESAAC